VGVDCGEGYHSRSQAEIDSDFAAEGGTEEHDFDSGEKVFEF